MRCHVEFGQEDFNFLAAQLTRPCVQILRCECRFEVGQPIGLARQQHNHREIVVGIREFENLAIVVLAVAEYSTLMTVVLVIAIGAVTVLPWFLPKTYGWVVFIPFTLLLVIGIPYCNRTQMRIRQEEAQNKPPAGTR